MFSCFRQKSFLVCPSRWWRLLLGGACLLGGAAMAAEGRERFSLPEQSLGKSLEEFSLQTGISVGVRTDLLRGKKSRTIEGEFTPEEALKLLLVDSGLEFRFVEPGAVAVTAKEIPGGKTNTQALAPVTIQADKLPRDLQETYASVSVVDAAKIEDLGIRDLRDSLRLMANVGTTPSNNGNTGISIRGINSEGLGSPGANLRPLASLVVDGAVQSFEGIRRGARGSWDVRQISVARGPQSTLQGRNALAGSIAIETHNPTPWFESAVRGGMGSQDALNGAVMVSGPVLEDEVMVRFAAEYAERELGIKYSDPVGDALDDEQYYSLRGKILWTPKAYQGFEALLTLSHVFDNPAVSAVNAADPFSRELSVVGTTAEVRENELSGGVLRLTWGRDNPWRFVSSSAYTFTDAQIWTPSPVYRRDEYRRDNDFTQDFRLEYQDEDNPEWELVSGAFFGYLKNNRDSLVRFNLPAPTPPYVYQNLESDSQTLNWALYGEARYRILPQLTLTAGLRYDREYYKTSFYDRILSSLTNTDTHYDAFLPRASLAWEFSPEHSLAATVSRGYRAGFVDKGHQVEPEFLWSYELAWRSTWLDRRLLFNATTFFYDWRDQQVTVPDPLNPMLVVTTNAGKSRAYGAEFEIAAVPLDAVTVGASVGLLRTELVEFGGASGKEFPEAPNLTASAWVDWRLPYGFRVGMDVQYKGEFFGTSDISNSPAYEVPAVTVWNAAIGWQHEGWDVAVFVRNIFDRDYLVGRDINNGAYVGGPRTWGVSVTRRF